MATGRSRSKYVDLPSAVENVSYMEAEEGVGRAAVLVELAACLWGVAALENRTPPLRGQVGLSRLRTFPLEGSGGDAPVPATLGQKRKGPKTPW